MAGWSNSPNLWCKRQRQEKSYTVQMKYLDFLRTKTKIKYKKKVSKEIKKGRLCDLLNKRNGFLSTLVSINHVTYVSYNSRCTSLEFEEMIPRTTLSMILIFLPLFFLLNYMKMTLFTFQIRLILSNWTSSSRLNIKHFLGIANIF